MDTVSMKMHSSYFHTLTVGEWEDTKVYTLPDPDYLSLLPEELHTEIISDTLNAAIDSITHRNCAIITSHSLKVGEWFVMIYVNDAGEVIPHLTIDSSMTNLTKVYENIIIKLQSLV